MCVPSCGADSLTFRLRSIPYCRRRGYLVPDTSVQLTPPYQPAGTVHCHYRTPQSDTAVGRCSRTLQSDAVVGRRGRTPWSDAPAERSATVPGFPLLGDLQPAHLEFLVFVTRGGELTVQASKQSGVDLYIGRGGGIGESVVEITDGAVEF